MNWTIASGKEYSLHPLIFLFATFLNSEPSCAVHLYRKLTEPNSKVFVLLITFYYPLSPIEQINSLVLHWTDSVLLHMYILICKTINFWGEVILVYILSDDLYQELDRKFQNVGKASAIDIDLVRFVYYLIV